MRLNTIKYLLLFVWMMTALLPVYGSTGGNNTKPKRLSPALNYIYVEYTSIDKWSYSEDINGIGYGATSYGCKTTWAESQNDLLRNKQLPKELTLEESIDDWLFSIDLLNNVRMKKDLIDFYVFSWGISDVDNLKQYYEAVRSKYPRFNLCRIENYLAKLERYDSFGLKQYPILKLDDVEIYEIKDRVSSYAMKHNEEIMVVDKFFESELFEPYLGEKAKSFVQFCNMVISACNSQSKEISIRNKEEMDLLIEYCSTIHWAANMQQNEAKLYALSHLFVGEEADEGLLRWLKKDFFQFYNSIIIVKPFNISAFENQVKSSSLDVFDKIALLKIVYPQFKDNDLLSKAIEEYNRIASSDKREECKARK